MHVDDLIKKQHKLKVKEWNEKHPRGTKVRFVDDLGNVFHTKTRSKAWCLFNGRPVVLIEGKPGGYSLWRIKPDD